MTKYLSLLKEQQILLRLAIIAGLLMALVILNQSAGLQSRSIKKYRQEKALVTQVPAMKQKIKGVQSNISRSSLKVEGVVNQNDGSYALINGEIHKAGDVVGDYKIIRIGPNTLTLLNEVTQEEENFVFQEAPQNITAP